MAARRQGARNVELDGDQLEGDVNGLSSHKGVGAFYRASHALLVGISSYGAGWRPLPGVVADLEAIRPLLEGLGFTVECKLDLDSNALSKAIREFLNRPEVGREDRVLLYFAGHGFTRRTQVGEEIGYLVPADAPSSKDEDFLAHALPVTHFEHWAREVNAKHVLFVFDACFAGTIFKTFRSSSLALSHRAAQPVRQFITSGGAGEAVPDESFFRQRFVEALQGGADFDGDGWITASQLGDFLFERVVEDSGGSQHPQHGKLAEPRYALGEFLLAVRPGVPLPALPAAGRRTRRGVSKLVLSISATLALAVWLLARSGLEPDTSSLPRRQPATDQAAPAGKPGGNAASPTDGLDELTPDQKVVIEKADRFLAFLQREYPELGLRAPAPAGQPEVAGLEPPAPKSVELRLEDGESGQVREAGARFSARFESLAGFQHATLSVVPEQGEMVRESVLVAGQSLTFQCARGNCQVDVVDVDWQSRVLKLVVRVPRAGGAR